ncbi:hypothetical protein FSP39_015004 [Pinctada imbricata]|uniref:Uncharacterized protein n=1 Tax=Pinctada imbricata TaxID=66713 RepID=A0AA88Y9G2_PINIB|nr:hypothetical protein FSP39_015004 [Pinctada imbricata]
MTKANELLERIIDQCGGLGRFQALAIVVFLISKGSVTWSTMMMAFGGAIPDWWCLWNNQSISQQTGNGSHIVRSLKSCSAPRQGNESSGEISCSSREFATDKWTVVSEVS